MAAPHILREFLNRRRHKTDSSHPFRKKTYRLGQVLRDVGTLLPRSGDLLRIYLFKDMSPALREAIMVAVARANDCRYCSFAHREWALSLGLDSEELAQVEHGGRGDLNKATTLAIEYARSLVQQEFGRVPLELEAALDGLFSLRERRDIETVARMMTIANLSGNTVDALLARLKGHPVADSRVPDELVLGGVFAVVAPVVVLLLAGLRGRTPLGIFKDFKEFANEFEQESVTEQDTSNIVNAKFKRVRAA